MRIARTLGAAAVALALTASLAACSSSPAAEPGASAGTGGDGAFPVEVEHVFGTTEIPAKPERIATVAWANHEVPLALGVVPVGMSKATWGDDDGDGVLPWVEDKLAELDAETPVLFDETDGIPFEEVADTQPDLILASYSGLTQEDYDTLSKIAPVVAYPEVAWGTSVQQMIEMNSTAMGMKAEGEQLIADLDARVQESLDAHPEMKDKTFLFSFFDPADLSQVGFYTSLDTRPGFLTSIGLPEPQVVVDESAKTDSFLAYVSSEEAERFDDVDVFVTYGDESLKEALQADPLLSQIPAIAEGRIALLGVDPLAASANPSPLSIGWGIDEYFDLLAGATGGAEG
ncbi:iron-siderophore ABC transporter substrate-binding protein [Microbacterium sp. NPDC096154]|uniref:iron-siderophore ABC transporter substrate-binding protein n=1 Tax=Microbacterium sp. NPDC096154 TaxID=3155549 RepID=UPI0033170C41